MASLYAPAIDEPPADDKGLREAVRARLNLVRDRHTELRAVAEQTLEAFLLVRRRDDQHRPNPAEHERRQRVVHHRLAVDRDELLADRSRQRMKARPGSAGEDDSLQHGIQ